MKRLLCFMLVLVFAFTSLPFEAVFAANVEIVNVFNQNNHDITEPVKLTLKLDTEPDTVKLTIGGYEYDAECTSSALRGEGYWVVSTTLTDGKMPHLGTNTIEVDVDGAKANTTIYLDRFLAQTDADTLRNTSFDGLDGKALKEIGTAIYQYYPLKKGGVQDERYVYSDAADSEYSTEENRLSFYICGKTNPSWYRVPSEPNLYSPEEISVSFVVNMKTANDGFRLDAFQYTAERLQIYKPNSTSWSWGIEIANDGKFADGTAVTTGKDYNVEVKYNRGSDTYEVFVEDEKLFGGNFKYFKNPGRQLYAFGFRADAPGEISFDDIVIETKKSFPEPKGLLYSLNGQNIDISDGGEVDMGADSVIVPMTIDASSYKFTDYESGVYLEKDGLPVDTEVVITSDGEIKASPTNGFELGNYSLVLDKNLKFGANANSGTAYGAETRLDFEVTTKFALVTPASDADIKLGDMVEVYGTLPPDEYVKATLDGVNLQLDTSSKPGIFSASIDTKDMPLGKKTLMVTNGTDTHEIKINVNKYVKERIYYDMSTFAEGKDALKQTKQDLSYDLYFCRNKTALNDTVNATRTITYGNEMTLSYTPTASGTKLNNTNNNGVDGVWLENTNGDGNEARETHWYDRKFIWSFDVKLPTAGYGITVSALSNWRVAVSPEEAVVGKTYRIELVEDYTGDTAVQKMYVDGVQVGATHTVKKPSTKKYEYNKVCAYKNSATWSQAEIDAGVAIPILTVDNIKYGFYEETPVIDENATDTSNLSFSFGGRKFDKASLEAAASLYVNYEKVAAAASYDADTNTLVMTPADSSLQGLNAKLVIKSTAKTALSGSELGTDLEYSFPYGELKLQDAAFIYSGGEVISKDQLASGMNLKFQITLNNENPNPKNLLIIMVVKDGIETKEIVAKTISATNGKHDYYAEVASLPTASDLNVNAIIVDSWASYKPMSEIYVIK